MPVHNWKPIEAGIFHAFHHNWTTEIAASLNRGLLPSDHYALPEQIAGGLGPDVLTLKGPSRGSAVLNDADELGSVALAEVPPKVQMRFRAEADIYAAKAKAIVVRHVSRHQVIAILEIVSPGNKNTKHGVRSFLSKAHELLRAGVHLVVVDVLPPGPRDPQGIHKPLWEEFDDNEFAPPADKPMTLASYLAGASPEAFVEPFAVGDRLVDMPLFLNAETYVPTPLEATYQSAFSNMPAYWREVIEQA